MKSVFNVREFGAKGDGITDDGHAIRAAIFAAIGCSGGVLFPPGRYLIKSELAFPPSTSRIAIFGDGQNVSTILAHNCAGINLSFAQQGYAQPYGATIHNLGFAAIGNCGTAIRISYGAPDITNDHAEPSAVISDVQIVSGIEGSWSGGVELEGAWNPILHNVFASGDSCGGNWNAMRGAGINLRGMCVNAHLSNVRTNFWAVGVQAHSANSRNTEGIFCSNCSMVAVKRGVWIMGDGLVPNAPRISTLTWNGGLIECRVGGVSGGSAGFHLDHVWTVLINGVQLITDTVSAPETTYGVFMDTCNGIVVNGCDINAWNKGVFANGVCRGISTHGNTFTNCQLQTEFGPDVRGSRSYGHTLVYDTPNEQDWSGMNKIGFIN